MKDFFLSFKKFSPFRAVVAVVTVAVGFTHGYSDYALSELWKSALFATKQLNFKNRGWKPTDR